MKCTCSYNTCAARHLCITCLGGVRELPGALYTRRPGEAATCTWATLYKARCLHARRRRGLGRRQRYLVDDVPPGGASRVTTSHGQVPRWNSLCESLALPYSRRFVITVAGIAVLTFCGSFFRGQHRHLVMKAWCFSPRDLSIRNAVISFLITESY